MKSCVVCAGRVGQLAAPCLRCSSAVGEPCQGPNGYMTGVHPIRLRARATCEACQHKGAVALTLVPSS